MHHSPPVYNQPVASPFHFEHALPFSAENASEILNRIPRVPGVFALSGPDTPDGPSAQPYLTRAADLRRRISRILAPPESPTTPVTKRLNLRDRVARIAYTVTGSELESTFTLYHAAFAFYGAAEARRRLKLHTPYCLRFTAENAYPRIYTTNRLSRRGLDQTYGPFSSRTAAERYCDAVLDLFQLRRCYEDLHPFPEHPGCAYGEMKKCLAPCNQTCTHETYADEAAAVRGFFDTRGERLLTTVSADRDQASADMDFERAAALHTHYQKIKAAASLVGELVRPIPQLRAVIVQAAADKEADTQEAAVFLLDSGCLYGPAPLSTLGVRAVKEQTSVGSSLFAQPLMLQAVPLGENGAQAVPDSPETRAAHTLATLQQQATAPTDIALLSDHLSLLRRWYYRPEKQRTGELFLPNADGTWPFRRILRAAARLALGEPWPMADTHRDQAVRNPEDAAQKPVKTKTLHAGRPDVEREVPLPVAGSFRSRKLSAAPD